MDPITFKIIVGISAGIGVLLLIAVAVFTFKKLKKRTEGGQQMKTDQNVLYGQYYNPDGERIDQGRVYAEDRNPNYHQAAKQKKTEQNVLYGLYYHAEGERIDEGRVYAEDCNLYYHS